MNLKKISFGNFKSLYNVSFEPGKINVFIGANGSGIYYMRYRKILFSTRIVSLVILYWGP